MFCHPPDLSNAGSRVLPTNTLGWSGCVFDFLLQQSQVSDRVDPHHVMVCRCGPDLQSHSSCGLVTEDTIDQSDQMRGCHSGRVYSVSMHHAAF